MCARSVALMFRSRELLIDWWKPAPDFCEQEECDTHACTHVRTHTVRACVCVRERERDASESDPSDRDLNSCKQTVSSVA